MSNAADTFRRVRKGEAVRAFSAETHNAVVEAAQRVERSGLLPDDGVRSAEPDDENAIYVLVKNTTGADQPQFAVLGVGAPLILPTQNLLGFKERRAVAGVAPAPGSPFVVMQQPVASNAIGLGIVLGVTPCVLNVAGTADTYAFPTTSTTQLTSGGDGPARILWKDSGTGPGINALILITQDDDAACCCGTSTGGTGSGPPVTKPPTTTTTGGMIQTMTGGGTIDSNGMIIGNGPPGGGTGGVIGPPSIHCPPGQHLTYDADGNISGCATNDGSWLGGRSGGAARPMPEPTHPLGRIQGNRVGFQGGRWFFPSEIVGGAALTTGDILYYDSASPTGFSILSLGAAPNGYVLTLAGGLPSWAAAGGGSSATLVGTPTDVSAATTTQTLATYTAGASNEVVRVGGYLLITAVGFGDSVALAVTWTDVHGAAQTINLLGSTFGGTIAAYDVPDRQLRAKNGTNVTVTATVSGTPTYDGGATVEKAR